jgi:hypothetical protein
MALTATFAADFSQFESSLQNATVKLQGFEKATSTAARDLQRTVNELSGQKVASEAARMVEAVERLGGTTKLTADEAARVNRVVGEAIEKFRVLGTDAPPKMAALHEATKPIAEGNKSILETLTPLAGAFGVAFSVGAVVQFGRELLADADALVKLSEKTGIAIEPLQQLKHLAEQSGVSLESMSGAITQMQIRIAGGDKSAVGALRALGLSIEELRALSPERQFIEIAQEVGRIEDPMERARTAYDLFGRKGTEVLPVMLADIKAISDEAPVMSQRTVESLDSIGDAMDRFMLTTKSVASETLVLFVDGLKVLGATAKSVATLDITPLLTTLHDAEAETLPNVTDSFSRMIPPIDGVSLSMEEMDRVSRELTTSLEKQWQETERLQRLSDSLFGRDTIKRANEYVTALGGVENVTKLTYEKKQELARTIDAALKQYQALGEQAPPELKKIKDATFDLDAEMEKLNAKTLPAFTGLLQNIDRTLDPLPTDLAAVRTELRFQAETIETALIPELDALQTEYQDTAREAMSWVDAMEQVRKKQGTMTAQGAQLSLADFDAKYQEFFDSELRLGATVAEAQAKLARNRSLIASNQPRALATGGRFDAGERLMVGERGPEMVTFGRAGVVTPNRELGGSSTVVNIHITQPLGTPDQIARVVGDALTQRFRGAGVRLPAGI